MKRWLLLIWKLLTRKRGAIYYQSNAGWISFSLTKKIYFLQLINNNEPKGKPWHELGRKRKRVLTANITDQLEDLAAERRTEPVKIAANIIRRWTLQPTLHTCHTHVHILHWVWNSVKGYMSNPVLAVKRSLFVEIRLFRSIFFETPWKILAFGF